MHIIEKRVREYILSELLMEGEQSDFDNDAPLLEKGIIDSIGLVRLVVFLEESLGVRIPEEDLRAENFRSITHIVNYIEAQGEATKTADGAPG
jgi:acyl carrier protein